MGRLERYELKDIKDIFLGQSYLFSLHCRSETSKLDIEFPSSHVITQPPIVDAWTATAMVSSLTVQALSYLRGDLTKSHCSAMFHDRS